MSSDNPNNKINLLAKEKIDLQEHIFTIKRHKWSIVGITTIVLMITAFVVYSMNPVYRATTTLLIEAEQAKIVSIEEIYGLDTGNAEYFATQLEIMKSRDLIEKVVDRLDLLNHPEYNASENENPINIEVDWRSWLPFELPEIDKSTESTAEDNQPAEKIDDVAKQGIIDSFLANLSISPIRKTHLVNISFEAHDRFLAADAVNTLADVYIESHLDAKLQMTTRATSWLTGRMEKMKEQLAESEKQLQQYREKENIIEVKGIRTIAAKDLQEISTNLISAKERRAVAENLYKQVRDLKNKSIESIESIPAVLNNKLVQNLKDAEAKAERNLAELSKRYGPQHPKMVAAQSKLDAASKKIKRQIDTVIAGVEKDYEISKKNEETLQRALNKSKKEIQTLNRKEFQLRELERDVETNRKLYDTFFNRFQETSATSDLQTVNARVLDRAIVPRDASKPRKKLALMIALIASLVFGILRAFLKEHLGNTFRSTEDVESKLGISTLGILPLTKTGPLQKLNPLDIFSRSEYVALAEAIRTIRTGIILSGLDQPKKVTLITSSVPNEGKTTLSIGLAMALGQVEKVLLIDADLRHPSLTKNFDLPPNSPGVSALVAGTEKLENCIHTFSKANIDLLPSGLIPPNPLELLSSKRFKALIEELETKYDKIIIDSAPTQAVSDSLILSSYAQSVIYMVKADSTASHVALSGIKRLTDSNAPLMGVVLNQLDVMKASKFSNYEYYNDGYYGKYGTQAPTVVSS